MVEYSGRKAIATALGYAVKEGKGRMAKDVSAAVDAAIAAGTHSVAVKVVSPRTAPVKAAPTVKVKAKPANGILEAAPQIWPDTLRVTEVESGLSRSVREACNNCRVSLQWCQCHLRNPVLTPTISSSHGSVAVRLEV